ncbi:nucleotidyltransferase [Clostridium gasigenes]|uniref:tRNA(Met) cytidine acetate ligase n=1 Tax=Clostridium gasigenes TaxID=94869 RepID=A0A7X0VR85_9CLOT|nr:nucleotidyltransferase [Clostridium gasigenes]MBB6715127.1 nucleotidyltransferase [Clostridium gasigenes]MBU3104078.1 nucleotidyltransferase [Clostridium gasigenes]
MNITGIITEYNPFHNGHLHHLSSARAVTGCDGVVCIMSGNFMQRGEPAIIDKWERTSMAIENGVDLVIELPTFYALSSAEHFAKGSLSILDSLGIINNIFFGSECGNVEDLVKIASVLTDEPLEFKNELKVNLNKGLTFAKSRELSLVKVLEDETLSEILQNSNNILGIEYIKAILSLNSKIKPITLKRKGSAYNDKNLSSEFASATSIRESLKNPNSSDELAKYMPPKSYEILKKLQENDYPFIFEEEMFKFIKYRIVSNCINFNNLLEISEGLDNKIIKEIYNSNSYEEFVLNIKSKRYTYTKISRLLTQIFIGLDIYNSKNLFNKDLLYARILGFNHKGREILKEMKKTSTIPLITKVPKNIDNPLLELDIAATKCYSLLNAKVHPFSDYLKGPIIKH